MNHKIHTIILKNSKRVKTKLPDRARILSVKVDGKELIVSFSAYPDAKMRDVELLVLGKDESVVPGASFVGATRDHFVFIIR